MTFELTVTPAGNIALDKSASAGMEPGEPWMKSVASAFSSGQSSGLFALAAAKPSGYMTASATFFRDLSSRYLSELCRTPEFASGEFAPSVIEPPSQDQLSAILSNTPPMPGAEYLNAEVLENIWRELDDWVAHEVLKRKGKLSEWLKEHAPQWHQVGRVCFHLAENKRDQEHPFAFLATYAPQLSAGGRVQYQPLSRALQEHALDGDKKTLIRLLSPVHAASEKSSLVQELLASNDLFHPLPWTPSQAYRLLKDVPILEESGLLVKLPDWWQKRPRPRVKVTIGEKKRGNLGMDAMLDFRVALAVDDAELTAEELEQLMQAQEGLVYLKGRWIEVDPERLAEAIRHWKKLEKKAAESGISFIEGMRLLAGAPAGLDSGTQDAAGEQEGSQWSHITAGSWLCDILASLRDPGLLIKADTSKNFNGTLRPYQKAGHDWLWFLSNLGLGACLADDMGLGKTVQVLSLLLSIKENRDKLPAKPSLLVLPASLLSNWKSEMFRFAPTLSATFLHPSECSDTDLSTISGSPQQSLAAIDLVVTTYAMLLRQSWLEDIDWRLVILDEAQTIKNPSAGQTRAAKRLKAESRIALTGTPVENRLADLWSLFDFLSPGLLGSAEKFKRFVKKLEGKEQPSYAPLRNLVGPYILRRLKTDKNIITDLPDKTELKVFCGLAKEQAALYSKSVDELKEALAKVDGIQRRGLVLSFLLRFKQICNHPSQLSGDGVYAPQKSGKFERLKAIADEIASRQEKVIVFTQFREMTDPLFSLLADVFGRPGLVLHGGTAVGKRKSIVDAFQSNDGPPYVVLSLKAGGTGLNLTAASHVVHFDRWWNPAVENQATDRAFRIGQHKNVLVHKFICRGTIEEKIDQLIEEKTALAEGILTGGAESKLTEMSDKELLDIVSLDLESVCID